MSSSMPARLDVVAFAERWVHAGSSSSVDNDEVEVLEEAEEAASSEGVGEHVVGLQLEGCAPIELRPVLKAAAREHLDKSNSSGERCIPSSTSALKFCARRRSRLEGCPVTLRKQPD